MAEPQEPTPTTPTGPSLDPETDTDPSGSEIDWNVVMERGWEYGESLLGAILVLLVGAIAIKLVCRGLRSALDRREQLDEQVKVLAVRIVRLLLWLVILVAVLGKFGIQTASIIAVLGGLGLAVGLALQGSLSNVASGVMLMVLRPFTIGQVIKVSGEFYIVDDIGLFATRAHLPDGPRVTIPNNRLWGSEIVNLSSMHDDLRRIDETFGIAYGDDIDRAFAVIASVLDQDERYLDEPERLIAVTSLGDSSVNILCRVWVAPGDWWFAKLDLIKAVKQAFDREGITIPFPQRDVHLDGAPASG